MTIASKWLPAGLFLVFLALCVLIGFEAMSRPQQQPSDLAAGVVTPPRVETADASQPPDQRGTWFRDIVARPLFSPDRRPVTANTHSVAGLPRLTGIVVAGSRRLAIFAAGTNGRPIVVEAGSHVGVYSVRDIADGAVTVVGPEGTSVIRPIFDAAPAAPGAKPALAIRPELSRPGQK